jgi:hypothetical protein
MMRTRPIISDGAPRPLPAGSAVVLASLLLALLVMIGCAGNSGQAVQADQTRPAEPVNNGAADAGRAGEPANRIAEAVPEQPSPVLIPSGARISVRLLSSISSASAKSGEEFDAELAAPVTENGTTVIEKGARVRGHVVSARESGRLQKPGYLKLTLDSIDVDGRQVPIRTTAVSATGGSHKKRNVTLIGGGAAVGAAIGAIAGGGKGAAIGAASGAGAGTAGALATGKKDVTFSAERRLAFQTTGVITLKK